MNWRSLPGTLRSFSARRRQSTSNLLNSLRRDAPIDVHPEIQDSLATGQPVVALESTIITHGMPQPINLETARSVERIVRSTGAVPATIAMLGGRIKIGLESSELEYLADTKLHPSVEKLSRRDIAPAVVQKKYGGTTCSATLIFAALAGIKVFATGGLGGVHRGGENSMDVSADLNELTRCPVGLVSAGVKSILDIGRTLEYLETLGVPVLSYAQTNDFPAFYTRRSGFKAPWHVNDPEAAAKILFTHWQIGMKNGALFGVPIPERYEAVGEALQQAVEAALAEADQNGMNERGKEVTPWLLRRIGELTKGSSLASNIALIENTALVGGQIAVEYAKLLAQKSEDYKDGNVHILGSEDKLIKSPIKMDDAETQGDLPLTQLVVVGSAAVDISAMAKASTAGDVSLSVHSTSPGTVSMTLGGVARNIAETAHRVLTSHAPWLSIATMLVSPVGDDASGRVLLDEMHHIGMRTDGLLQIPGARSAVCNMVFDSAGNLTGGVADMDIIQLLDGQTVLQTFERHRPSIIALDGNVPPTVLKSLVKYGNENEIDVLYEPTSVIKSTAILPAVAACLELSDTRSPIAYATPNLLELARLYNASHAEPLNLMSYDAWRRVIDDFAISHRFRMELEQLAKRNVSDDDTSKGSLSFLVEDGIAQMAVNLLPFFQNIVIKCGERGLIVAMRVSGPDAATSQWAQEHSNLFRRRIVAHGKLSREIVVLLHIPALPLPKESIVNVTGAGDTLVGSMLASLLLQKKCIFSHPSLLDEAMHAGQQAAILTLKSSQAVSPLLASMARD